jgi:hypothetical protein
MESGEWRRGTEWPLNREVREKREEVPEAAEIERLLNRKAREMREEVPEAAEIERLLNRKAREMREEVPGN